MEKDIWKYNYGSTVVSVYKDNLRFLISVRPSKDNFEEKSKSWTFY